MAIKLIGCAPNMRHFNFIITLSIIGALSIVLMTGLNSIQRDIEDAAVEADITNLRIGLMSAWTHHTVTFQQMNIESLRNSNPMLLMQDIPVNYIGELDESPINQRSIWYFDTHNKQLIYVFNDGHQVKYTLSSTAGLAKVSLLSVGGIDLVRIMH